MEIGREVGELARLRFPQGAFLQGLSLEDCPGDVAFEVTFQSENFRARTDILRRNGTGWDLIEVKSSKRESTSHLYDLAFQAMVMKQAGIEPIRCLLLLVNGDYVLPESGKIDPEQFFTQVDLTEEVLAAQPKLEVLANQFHHLIQLEHTEPPTPDFFAACKECSFKSYCSESWPEHPVSVYLSRSKKQIENFRSKGIIDFRDVPQGELTTSIQRSWHRVLTNDAMEVDPDLADRIANLEYPVYCIDFETVGHFLPWIAAVPSYQKMPVQFSCHRINAPYINGVHPTVDHFEYIFRGDGDPREDFVKALSDVLGDHGSVMHYSAAEKTELRNLETAEIPGAKELSDRLIPRFVDLEKWIKDYFWHPGLAAKSSIKKVLPILAPDLSYDSLEINSGETAMVRYQRAITGKLPTAQAEKTFQDLLEYCKLDTWAMVRIIWALQDALAGKKF